MQVRRRVYLAFDTQVAVCLLMCTPHSRELRQALALRAAASHPPLRVVFCFHHGLWNVPCTLDGLVTHVSVLLDTISGAHMDSTSSTCTRLKQWTFSPHVMCALRGRRTGHQGGPLLDCARAPHMAALSLLTSWCRMSSDSLADKLFTMHMVLAYTQITTHLTSHVHMGVSRCYIEGTLCRGMFCLGAMLIQHRS